MEIITLTQSDIDEYEGCGYDSSHLRVGARVLCDDELYMTYEQIECEISSLSSGVKRYNWIDADEMNERVKMLEAALLLLKKN